MNIIIRKIKLRRFISNFLLIVFFTTYLCEYMNVINLLTANILFVSIGILAIISTVSRRRNKTFKYFFMFVGLYTILWTISYLYNGNSDIIEIFWPFAFFGIGFMIACNDISSRITSVLYIFFVAYISMIILNRGGADYIGGSSSRNTVSVSIVLFLSIHMIASYKEKKSVPFVYSVFASIGCLLAIGRSGVLLTVLVLFLFASFAYENGVSRIRNLKLMLRVILLLIVLLYIAQRYFPYLIRDAVYNFQWRGTDSRRIIMWRDYLNKITLNPVDMLLGAEISGTYQLDYYHDNLHNSFLMLHAKYGIGGIILVLLLLIKILIVLIKEKNMYLFTPLILMFFRMNFDYTNFNGVLDIVMSYYLTYYWNFRQRKGAN